MEFSLDDLIQILRTEIQLCNNPNITFKKLVCLSPLAASEIIAYLEDFKRSVCVNEEELDAELG